MFLKQSTTVYVYLGPYVDDTDGKTAETALSITAYLSKAGAAAAARNSATGISHDRDGYYRVELNTTDTGTAGLLELFANATGALPVWRHLVILTANNYDALIAGSDALQVHANEITANLITAAALAADAGTEIASAVWANATRTLSASGDPSAAQIADAVWDEARADHTAAGSFGQIIARIGAIRRRTLTPSRATDVGDLRVFSDGRDPEILGDVIALPRRERRILEYLVANRNRRVSRNQIFNAVYGLFDEEVEESVVESHISKLRKKLRQAMGYDPIDTKRYLGYQIIGRPGASSLS